MKYMVLIAWSLLSLAFPLKTDPAHIDEWCFLHTFPSYAAYEQSALDYSNVFIHHEDGQLVVYVSCITLLSKTI